MSSHDLKRYFEKNGTRLEFEKDQILVQAEIAPDGIYILESGYCLVINHGEMGDKIHAIYGCGAVFPLRFAVNGEVPSASFKAIEKVVAYRISTADFRELSVGRHGSEVLDVTLKQLGCYVRGVNVLEHASARDRVWFKLIDLADQLGSRQTGFGVLPFRLTHEQLSKMTNISRETASRILTELADKGDIKYVKNRIAVNLARM